MGICRLIDGFIHTENVPNGAFLYWINPATKLRLVATAVYIINVRKQSRQHYTSI